MVVCRGCESKLMKPWLSKDRKITKCHICWDKTLCSKVLVGS